MSLLEISLSFFPQEISQNIGLSTSVTIIFQILGALYFGFAILNWTAKANLMGGIYSRPVAIGNFSHFLIGGLTLIKFGMNHANLTYIWVSVAIYSIFAIAFGYVLFTSPVLPESKNKLDKM